MSCKVCSGPTFELGYVGLKSVSVTSDSKLCGTRVPIHHCRACGHLQKAHTAAEWAIVGAIYERYDIHHLSGGSEQLVFPPGLPPRTRSYHAFEQCLGQLPAEGRLLDIGTGNGAVLKSASVLLPNWCFDAFDITDRYREAVLSIMNVKHFYAGALEDLPDASYDLIVLWHVLEHVPDPALLLGQVRERLNTRGFLLIQVPDVRRTPFDLAVIDHCSHFTNQTLRRLSEASDFSVILDGYDWTHNCNTLLLRRGPEAHPSGPRPTARKPSSEVYFRWLNRALEDFEVLTQALNYGLFGTGMASLWMLGQLSRTPLCLIDEDRAKSQHWVQDVPILHPDDLDQDFPIIMPFIHSGGEAIARRLRALYPSCRVREILCASSDPDKDP